MFKSRSKIAASVGRIRLNCEALEHRNAPSDMLAGLTGIAQYGSSDRLWLGDTAAAADSSDPTAIDSSEATESTPVPFAWLDGPANADSGSSSQSPVLSSASLHAVPVGDLGTPEVSPLPESPAPVSGGPAGPEVGASNASATAAAPDFFNFYNPYFHNPYGGGFGFGGYGGGSGGSGSGGGGSGSSTHAQTIAGLSPTQVRTAYGFASLPSADSGKGVTIAIIDAYNAQNITSDLQTFDTQFSLQQFNVSGGPTFKVVNETGGTSLPQNDSGWAAEIALDVEWAHAMAPQANITLVEASSASTTDLFKAASYGAAHAQVVSMSWDGTESSTEGSGSNALDKNFEVPGVAFVAAAGDDGAGVGYPAASSYVIAVGGTTLTLNSNGSYGSESAWSDSGGGISADEAEPTYQSAFGVTGTGGKRANPDISFDANPMTGVAVYSSPNGGWEQVGGTSLGSPSIAGLIADADGARIAAGKAVLSTDSTSTNFLYAAAATPALYAANYHDITTGSNGGSSTDKAKSGYDFVTGLGTPNAANLVPWLAAY